MAVFFHDYSGLFFSMTIADNFKIAHKTEHEPRISHKPMQTTTTNPYPRPYRFMRSVPTVEDARNLDFETFFAKMIERRVVHSTKNCLKFLTGDQSLRTVDARIFASAFTITFHPHKVVKMSNKAAPELIVASNALVDEFDKVSRILRNCETPSDTTGFVAKWKEYVKCRTGGAAADQRARHLSPGNGEPRHRIRYQHSRRSLRLLRQAPGLGSAEGRHAEGGQSREN